MGPSTISEEWDNSCTQCLLCKIGVCTWAEKHLIGYDKTHSVLMGWLWSLILVVWVLTPGPVESSAFVFGLNLALRCSSNWIEHLHIPSSTCFTVSSYICLTQFIFILPNLYLSHPPLDFLFSRLTLLLCLFLPCLTMSELKCWLLLKRRSKWSNSKPENLTF